MTMVVCIAGPTASGKSALAVELAKRVDGEIINADSMQVYADLHILSARPDSDEMNGVPHHLFGHIDGSVRYSVGQWVRDVVPVIRDCQERGKTPFLVGGTGLYFQALTEGLAEVPVVSEEARLEACAFQACGQDALYDRAQALDPVAVAKIERNDSQRLMRVIGVALTTGKPLSAWQADTKPVIPREAWEGLMLLPDRERLYEKINARLDMMIESSGLEEVKILRERALSPSLPVMKAIGVPPLLRMLEGTLSFDEAVSEAKRDTRRFAKRQFTWFRGKKSAWTCAEAPSDLTVFEVKNAFKDA